MLRGDIDPLPPVAHSHEIVAAVRFEPAPPLVLIVANATFGWRPPIAKPSVGAPVNVAVGIGGIGRSGLFDPLLGDDLLAIPVTVMEEEATKLGEVNRAAIKTAQRRLKATRLAVQAPRGGILHAQRRPDLLLQVLGNRHVGRSL